MTMKHVLFCLKIHGVVIESRAAGGGWCVVRGGGALVGHLNTPRRRLDPCPCGQLSSGGPVACPSLSRERPTRRTVSGEKEKEGPGTVAYVVEAVAMALKPVPRRRLPARPVQGMSTYGLHQVGRLVCCAAGARRGRRV